MTDTEYTFSHLVDAELAQYVMGWVYVEPHVAKRDPPGDYDYVYSIGDHEMGGPYVYRRRYGAGDFYKWSPTNSDADALDVAKRLQAIGYHIHITLEANGCFVCAIDPSERVQWEDGERAIACTVQFTLRAAICGAAEEWVTLRVRGEEA